MNRKSVMIFGVGSLQKSIIEHCKKKGLFIVGIDPDENAVCKDIVDSFEIVDGNDYDKTLNVAKKHNIQGLITAATDKPLVMMARIAKDLDLSFYTVETAQYSTDKYLMKQKFNEFNIPCAKGFIVNHETDIDVLKIDYPVIIKPRDNSGSRGVISCENLKALKKSIKETFKFTKKGNILVEEFIEGQEYSVESIHYKDKSHVIQITEKKTTKFPYNVELGHLQPASVTLRQKLDIEDVIIKIAKALGFENCASHTELKINSKGIKIIETSPRLGGDFISSTLVPLSTGVNMEDLLIDISIKKPLVNKYYLPKKNVNAAIIFFELKEGLIVDNVNLDEINDIKSIYAWSFDLKKGNKINKITSSLNRYGYAIVFNYQRKNLFSDINKINLILNKNINIK